MPPNEGTTVGTGNAIQEAGENIIGVGFDKSDVILDLVEGGFVKGVMAQNPDIMGYEGVKVAAEAFKDNNPSEEYIDIGVSVITKDNAADFR